MKTSLRASWKRLFVITLAFVVLSPSAAVFAQESNAAQSTAALPQPLITQAVSEAQLTVLKGNTHPLAKPQFDLGTAPATLPMQRMLLVLKRSPAQEAALRKLLDDQQDKHSPSYHKWLTPTQYGKQFGPTDSDLQTITTWLQSHGFQVGTTKGRTVLEFSGSASQVQQAFHTAIHKYVVNGEQHWANSSDPQIPTALMPAVAGISTLHNFIKKPTYRLSKDRGTIKRGTLPQVTFTDGSHGLVPGDYAVIYNINPVYTTMNINGNGITIGVVGRSDIEISDVSDFQNAFGLTSNLPVPVINGPDPGDVPGDDLEGTLDATWSQAIAPGATVDFVISATTNTTDGTDLSELYIVENNLANVMTESFGSCEAFSSDAQVAATEGLAEQAAAQGITYTVSTGDAGAEGCDDPNSETVATGPISVNVLASTPFTVGVGGTIFNENGQDATYWNPTSAPDGTSVISYIPEDVWNDSCTSTSCSTNANIASGGGGASLGNTGNGGTFTGFPRPSWQSGVTGIPTGTTRYLPDVALSAAPHDGYVICFQGSCQSNELFVIGGTSASAPSFAGIMALVDQRMGQVEPTNGSRQGQADYVLYPLAVTETATLASCNASSTPLPSSSCIFNDVTAGNNEVPGEPGYPNAPYNSGVGYDPASGLGSVNVANLVNNWASATFQPTTTTLTLNSGNPVNITHGTSVSVGISVTANSGTPTGDVSLSAAVPANVETFLPLFTGPNGSNVFTLSGGSLSASTEWLPGSTVLSGSPVPYSVTAHYAGNSTFAPSDSNAIMVTVTPESSTTTLSQFTEVIQNNQFVIVPLSNGATLPFGSLVFVRADVVGSSGQGIPTGAVKFADTFLGGLPQPTFGSPVANPEPLNGQGNSSIGDGLIDFDAGNHSISGTYLGDDSFSPSLVSNSVSFTIQPGFAEVSGPGSVTVASPGMSGTTAVGIIASTGFNTAISFSCTGLPAEASCGTASATGTGPNNIVNTTITVTTTAAHTTTTMLQPKERPYYLAMILGGGMPLAGLFLVAAPRRRRWTSLLGLMLVALLLTVPACGGGGGSKTHTVQDPGTPAGTYNITLTATAGALSEQATFTLTVQ